LSYSYLAYRYLGLSGTQKYPRPNTSNKKNGAKKKYLVCLSKYPHITDAEIIELLSNVRIVATTHIEYQEGVKSQARIKPVICLK